MPLDHPTTIIDTDGVARMSMQEVLTIKQACDARIAAIKDDFIAQAAALGLSVVNGKKPKQRRVRTAHAD